MVGSGRVCVYVCVREGRFSACDHELYVRLCNEAL